MFLTLSAQIAQLPRSRFDAAQPLMVGRMWYRLLVDLLAQLALSAGEFHEYTAVQVQQSMDLVAPGSASRASLYPSLWCTADSEHIAQFDVAWRDVQRLAVSVAEPSSPASKTAELLQLCPPHDFSNNLATYLKAVADRLDPPLLTVYSNIRQSGSFPCGFFEAPGMSPSQAPARPRPADPDAPAGADNGGGTASPMVLDPSSPPPQSSMHRAFPLRPAESEYYGLAESPPGRMTRPLAHSVAPASAKLVRTRYLPTLADGDADESCVSDMEMSPSQHASMKRQRSSGAATSTPPRRGHSADTSVLGHDGADIENTVVMESPSALLSAKHDRRVRASLQRLQAPPPLCMEPSMPRDIPPLAVTETNSMAITPPSQARRRLEQGDVEGGGRPRRRRHHEPGELGTPKGVQASLLLAPPPQTLLSPRNIAAARRSNIPLDTLIAESTGHGASSSSDDGGSGASRKRPRGSQLVD
ncbi:hypothetical protein H4R19_003270 [Coemansia spiralis]|nr:hypothetical protein H4R19_003270 [Coemansia spiralis]